MLLNNNVNEKLPLSTSKLCVVIDFDKTLTDEESCSTWGVLSKSNFFSENYVNEVKRLYEIYYPLENDFSIELEQRDAYLKEWWQKHLELIVEENLQKDVVTEVATNLNYIKLRRGAFEFLEALEQKNVPIILISSGVGNVIETFLKFNNCTFKNLHIISNFIKFENGIAVGMEKQLIHSYNKNTASLTEELKKVIDKANNILLLGDQIGDLQMVSDEQKQKTISVGFNSKNKNVELVKKQFDIFVEQNNDYFDLIKTIFDINF